MSKPGALLAETPHYHNQVHQTSVLIHRFKTFQHIAQGYPSFVALSKSLALRLELEAYYLSSLFWLQCTLEARLKNRQNKLTVIYSQK